MFNILICIFITGGIYNDVKNVFHSWTQKIDKILDIGEEETILVGGNTYFYRSHIPKYESRDVVERFHNNIMLVTDSTYVTATNEIGGLFNPLINKFDKTNDEKRLLRAIFITFAINRFHEVFKLFALMMFVIALIVWILFDIAKNFI